MENAAIRPAIQRRFPHNIVVMLIGSYPLQDIVAVNDARALMRSCGICTQTGEAACRASLLPVLGSVIPTVTAVAPVRAAFHQHAQSPGNGDSRADVFRPPPVCVAE